MISKQEILMKSYRRWKLYVLNYSICKGILELAGGLLGIMPALLEQIFNDAYMGDDTDYKKLMDSLKED